MPQKLTPESFLHKVIRHYKGNYYFVEEISTDSETLEPVLIYRPLYPSEHKLYNRPFKMFTEPIDPKAPNNLTGQSTRFEIVTNLHQNHRKNPLPDTSLPLSS